MTEESSYFLETYVTRVFARYGARVWRSDVLACEGTYERDDKEGHEACVVGRSSSRGCRGHDWNVVKRKVQLMSWLLVEVSVETVEVLGCRTVLDLQLSCVKVNY